MCIRGTIYKIQHLDSSLCYIGSTCDSISGRWRTHKKAYSKWIKNKDEVRTISLYPHLEQYGFDRFQMLLIKEYQVADKKQLRAYEQLAIGRTKSCCNQIAALQLINSSSMARHYRQANKQAIKDYHQVTKQAINKRMKEYRQTNKQVILHQAKEYYQANKQAISEQQKRYRQANKNHIKEHKATRIVCECGTKCRKDKLTAHRKTAKHARLLAALSTPTQ